jgi:hypothetical protein
VALHFANALADFGVGEAIVGPRAHPGEDGEQLPARRVDAPRVVVESARHAALDFRLTTHAVVRFVASAQYLA